MHCRLSQIGSVSCDACFMNYFTALCQENPDDLKKLVRESEPILAAFALVAEHGAKSLNRYRALAEG